MTSFRVVLAKAARNDLRRLDKQVATRIHKKLVVLATSKQFLDTAVRLTKPADAQYRWRIGNYRVLFDFNPATKTATILKIQHRKQIYRQ